MSHGRGGRRTPPNQGQRAPSSPPGMRPGPACREVQPCLILGNSWPPCQLQPSWSSPTAPHRPSLPSTQPLTGPHLPAETTARPRARRPAFWGLDGSRLCLSPPNGSAPAMHQPHQGSPGRAPGGLPPVDQPPSPRPPQEPSPAPCQVCLEALATLCRQGSCAHHPTALGCWELHSGWENSLCSTPAPSPRVLRGEPLPARAPPRQVLQQGGSADKQAGTKWQPQACLDPGMRPVLGSP